MNHGEKWEIFWDRLYFELPNVKTYALILIVISEFYNCQHYLSYIQIATPRDASCLCQNTQQLHYLKLYNHFLMLIQLRNKMHYNHGWEHFGETAKYNELYQPSGYGADCIIYDNLMFIFTIHLK